MALPYVSTGLLVFAKALNSPWVQSRPDVAAEIMRARDHWLQADQLISSPPASALVALVKSVDGTPHEGRVPGVGIGWDFYVHGVIQRPRGSNQAASAWLSFQDPEGNLGGLTVEVQKFQQFAFDGIKWHFLTNEIKGSQVHPIPPHEGGVEGNMGVGPVFTIPQHGKGTQAWSYQHALPPNTQGIVTVGQVRLPAGAPTNTSLLITAGGDWWPVDGSASGNVGAMVGQYIKPTFEWRWFGGSHLPAAALIDNPPPIVV